ncbi:MAG: hypothetical protein J6P87_10300 [Lachnospiraceae bacterium]|nr:hypothetical protein [Lachnospiraceae bacterium]
MKKIFRSRRAHSAVILLILTLLIPVLTACSDARAKELGDFRGEVSAFFDRYKAYNETIASIDVSDPNAGTVLLTTADKMLSDAKALRNLKAPDGFDNFTHYAEEYCTHIENAVSSLHRAFGEDAFDQASFDAALPELDAASSSLSFMAAELRQAAETE